MRPSTVFLLLVLLAWAASSRTGPLGRPAAAQSSCAATFFAALVQLMPCRPAVAPFGPAPPSEACCNAIRNLGQACLCAITNGPPITGVDRNMALQLPAKCTVNFEPCTVV